MYDDSSITDTESLSMDVSVASILGIKGGLRLRHHSVSQKAHIILREASEDSSDDEKESNVACFRLFANKHINLKPGRELLLTIASRDGRFKDQVVMFEGNLRGSDQDSDHEGTTQVEEEPQVIEEEEEVIPQAAMPPKMRRQWTRKAEELNRLLLACSTQSSVSIQVQPSRTSASIQTYSSHASSAVQTDPPPLPSYISLDIQTDPILSSFEPSSIRMTVDDDLEHEPSLSPMLLSTPGSPLTSTELFIGLSGPRDPSEEMQLSTPEVKMEEIDEVIPLPFSVQLEKMLAKDIPHPLSVQLEKMLVKKEVVDLPLRIHPPPRPPPLVTDMFDLHDSTDPSCIPSPIGTKPAPRNPFVSGGFVTDFVGTVMLPVKELPPAVKLEEEANPDPPEKSQSKSNRRRAAKRARLRAEAQASPYASANAPSTIDGETELPVVEGCKDPSFSTQARESTPPPPSPLPQTPAPQRVRDTVQNAVASSSKIIPRAPPPLPLTALSRASTSIMPRQAPLAGWTKETAPEALIKQSHKGGVVASPSGSTPPPDPKSIAYIPSGPPSNRLNIRPSSSALPPPLARPTMLPPALARPPTSPAVPTAKKRVVVGRGWPFVRTVTAAAASPAASRLATQSSDLSSIVGYSSPSPPPANPPLSKWKRIDSEISITVKPRDALPLPSPIGETAGGDGAAALVSLKDRISAADSPSLLNRISTISSKDNTDGILRMPPDPGNGNNRLGRAPTQSSPAYWAPSTLQESTPSAAPPAVSSVSSTEKANPLTTAATKARSQKRSTQLPLHHSLPAKPPPSNIPPRGIKRERPPSPDLWTAPGIVRIQRRKHRWPTVEWTHSDLLKGDGDLGIRRIAFSADGSCFALHCAFCVFAPLFTI
ncbi:hypothetical protein DFH09DRAFT_6292 [Mycena vulgaris]|nr:hypothetical protein DFH09DRAFT_6292 [Mycena vulgaris]